MEEHSRYKVIPSYTPSHLYPFQDMLLPAGLSTSLLVELKQTIESGYTRTLTLHDGMLQNVAGAWLVQSPTVLAVDDVEAALQASSQRSQLCIQCHGHVTPEVGNLVGWMCEKWSNTSERYKDYTINTVAGLQTNQDLYLLLQGAQEFKSVTIANHHRVRSPLGRLQIDFRIFQHLDHLETLRFHDGMRERWSGCLWQLANSLWSLPRLRKVHFEGLIRATSLAPEAYPYFPLLLCNFMARLHVFEISNKIFFEQADDCWVFAAAITHAFKLRHLSLGIQCSTSHPYQTSPSNGNLDGYNIILEGIGQKIFCSQLEGTRIVALKSLRLSVGGVLDDAFSTRLVHVQSPRFRWALRHNTTLETLTLNGFVPTDNFVEDLVTCIGNTESRLKELELSFRSDVGRLECRKLLQLLAAVGNNKSLVRLHICSPTIDAANFELILSSVQELAMSTRLQYLNLTLHRSSPCPIESSQKNSLVASFWSNVYLRGIDLDWAKQESISRAFRKIESRNEEFYREGIASQAEDLMLVMVPDSSHSSPDEIVSSDVRPILPSSS